MHVNSVNLPKISIVTPSFNQGMFIEETILSVIFQNYPNLEYIIIDGNSTDESVEIIKKYEKQLAYWISEPDKGQYNAINKGFLKSTGEIMAWINSDDKYSPWAFSIVAEIFSNFPEIEWLTTSYGLHWDKFGRAVRCLYQGGYSRESFYKGGNLPEQKWFARGWIQQESTFWRRSLWEKAGAKIDDSLSLAGDFELWTKFFKEADLIAVAAPLGGFRVHGNQKTAYQLEKYLEEAEDILLRTGGSPYVLFESALRKIIFNCTGAMAYPKSRIPKCILPVLERTKILYPVKQCVWTPEGWQIRDAYII